MGRGKFLIDCRGTTWESGASIPPWDAPSRSQVERAFQAWYWQGLSNALPLGSWGLQENWKNRVTLLYYSSRENSLLTAIFLPRKQRPNPLGGGLAGHSVDDAIPQISTRWQSKEQNHGPPKSGKRSSRPPRLTMLKVARNSKEFTAGEKRWCCRA